jgi:hypothetical protein
MGGLDPICKAINTSATLPFYCCLGHNLGLNSGYQNKTGFP